MTDNELREWLKGRWYAEKCGGDFMKHPNGAPEVLFADGKRMIFFDYNRACDNETPAQAKDKILKLEQVQKLLGEVFE